LDNNPHTGDSQTAFFGVLQHSHRLLHGKFASDTDIGYACSFKTGKSSNGESIKLMHRWWLQSSLEQ
jgi:hypothetical protein